MTLLPITEEIATKFAESTVLLLVMVPDVAGIKIALPPDVIPAVLPVALMVVALRFPPEVLIIGVNKRATVARFCF